jgi:hypothetical protein
MSTVIVAVLLILIFQMKREKQMKYRVIVYEWIEQKNLQPQYMPMYDQAVENINIKKIIEVVNEEEEQE